MAKVTDIQDKNGVSKEIQDKDLANQTAASSIAATDYVMLQDTSGGYHKIAKASFTEAVRAALGSVISSVDKGTGIAKMPVLDSNNDLGMGSLANVASVLGGMLFKDRVYSGSMNDLKESGIYLIASNEVTNRPPIIGAIILFVKYAGVDERYIQYAFHTDSTKMYRRHSSYQGVWYDWVEDAYDIPSFYKNYNTLAELALGVGKQNIISGMAVTDMEEQWVTAMETSFQNADNAKFFSGYSAQGLECAWFGFKMYNNYATLIVFRSYRGQSILKGIRDSNGDWSFYKFLGGF